MFIDWMREEELRIERQGREDYLMELAREHTDHFAKYEFEHLEEDPATFVGPLPRWVIEGDDIPV